MPFQTHSPTSRSSRSTSPVLQAFQWILAFGGLAVVGFWAVYEGLGLATYDPLPLRLGVGGLFWALIGASYASRWVRERIWNLSFALALVMTAYFAWLGVRNDLSAPWLVGVLAAYSASVLSLASYARTERQVGFVMVVSLAALAGALGLAHAPLVEGALLIGYAAVLSTLIAISAVAQVRTRRAYRVQRDEASTRGHLLRTVVDAIPEHIYVKDREGRCLIRNRFSAEHMGFEDPAEAVGLTVFDQSEDPEVAAGYWEEEDLVMRTGEPILDHEEPYAYDGQTGWIETSRIPLRDEAGAVIGLIGITRDVTEKKEARAAILEAKEAAEAREAEAAAQRELLRTVINTIPDHIYVKDTEGRATLRNVASARALGYDDPDASVGFSDADAVADATAASALADDLHVIRTGEAIRNKEERALGDAWLLTTKVPLRDRAGRVTGLVGVSRDVTEQRKAQAALREAMEAAEARGRALAEQRELLQSLFDAIPDAIFVVDTDDRFVAVNAGTMAYFPGMERDEVVGKRRVEVLPPEVAEEYRAADDEAIASGQRVHRVVTTYVRFDGEEVTLETTRVTIRDEDGAVFGVVGVARDVTIQKAAEAGLIEAKEAAEAAREAAEDATRAKSEFLANMSHEIRTPMNGVIGMTSLLLDTPLGEEQREFVETLRTSGDALLTIITDLLDFSKIEAGMLALETHPFEIRTCVEEALDLVAQPAAAKGVELAYLVEDGVPRTVRGDITRVRQVLVNLLSNAVKFTQAGSVCVRVDAAPPDPEAGTVASVRFAVEDTGIGIAPDKLDAVFESFSQADASTTRQYGGTGLGLSICRRLVEMMGGTMGVESELGVGSTFTFSIEAEVAPSEKRVFLRSEQPALQGRRVLIVDDNDVNREILSRLSTRWRMHPVAVRSGAEALAAYEASVEGGRPYDLVLLDMQMPQMDGLDVARGIAARAPGRPPVLVMLTSIHREGSLRDEARQAGVHAVLYKPTKPSQLYDVLIEAFDGRPAAAPVPDAPAGPAPPDAPAAWVARPAPAEPPRRGLRILLAEDNVVNQKVAVRLLGRLGYTVDVVANGAEAVAEVERRAGFGEGYDVVLMDVQMPVMDGLAATRAIRASETVTDQPHIVALTANAMEGDREACLEAGTDDYLAKPVQLASMREAMDRAAQCRSAAAARADAVKT